MSYYIQRPAVGETAGQISDALQEAMLPFSGEDQFLEFDIRYPFDHPAYQSDPDKRCVALQLTSQSEVTNRLPGLTKTAGVDVLLNDVIVAHTPELLEPRQWEIERPHVQSGRLVSFVTLAASPDSLQPILEEIESIHTTIDRVGRTLPEKPRSSWRNSQTDVTVLFIHGGRGNHLAKTNEITEAAKEALGQFIGRSIELAPAYPKIAPRR